MNTIFYIKYYYEIQKFDIMNEILYSIFQLHSKQFVKLHFYFPCFDEIFHRFIQIMFENK